MSAVAESCVSVEFVRRSESHLVSRCGRYLIQQHTLADGRLYYNAWHTPSPGVREYVWAGHDKDDGGTAQIHCRHHAKRVAAKLDRSHQTEGVSR